MKVIVLDFEKGRAFVYPISEALWAADELLVEFIEYKGHNINQSNYMTTDQPDAVIYMAE